MGRRRDPVVDLVAGLTSISLVELVGFGQDCVIAGYGTNLGVGLFLFHGWGSLGHGNASAARVLIMSLEPKRRHGVKTPGAIIGASNKQDVSGWRSVGFLRSGTEVS